MDRTNPFEKYLSKEDVMQAEIARILSLRFPDLLWWHTANEGRRTPYEQYKFKALGGKSGVSDFVILQETNFSKGLMLEIKCGANGCSADQVDFLVRSVQNGYTGAVVYDFAPDALDLISEHIHQGVGIPSDGIILVKKGVRSVIGLEDAKKVLLKKAKAEKPEKIAKELFTAKALAKFGNSIPKSAWAKIKEQKKEKKLQSPKG
jgi:hypothetical protein